MNKNCLSSKSFLIASSFTRKMTKSSHNVKINGAVLSSPNYDHWSKEQLVDRIKLLENNRGDLPTVSGNHENKDFMTNQKSAEQSSSKTNRKKKVFDFSKYNKRFIALKFSYLGWNYQGLAMQTEETELPTVEFKIFEALNKVKLINSFNPRDCQFSRCGRTDRGVSAMNQVIALQVRSNLNEEELKDPENDKKEIDYVGILNRSLPADIKFHAICLRPPSNFDARFSCKFRHYKYIFDGSSLMVDKMNQAAHYFLGEHDFRNFCKVDASKQITNFKRDILASSIIPVENKPGYFVFDLKGTAFLWHQVRCMIAVLLSVGQGLEKPEIVQRLLDISEFPSKPIYNMAHDIPLVLYDCGFDEERVQWISKGETMVSNNSNFNGLWSDYQIKALIATFMKQMASGATQKQDNKITIIVGDGIGQSVSKYVAFDKRTRLETADQINAKWRSKKRGHDHIE